MKKVVELFKKQKLLIVIGIFILLGIVLSVSYALWSITKTQTNDNLVTAGCFDVDFVEVTDAITLSNALPITDEEGLQTSPYTFELSNTCSIAATYQINVEVLPVDNGQNKLADEHVKIDIDNLTSILSTNAELEPTITGASKSYTIKTGILDNGDSQTFDYRQWLDYDTTTAEGSNKQFKTKITITAFASLGTQYLASEPLSSPWSSSIFWGGPIERGDVETISFTTSNEVPAGVIGSWDAGLEKNGKVMAWYTDTDANGKYEVVAGAEGGVYAPPNSKRLFNYFEDIDILNFTNFDTSRVTNMSHMFASTGTYSSIFTLDLGDNFDTSNVTDMNGMFVSTGWANPVFTLDLGDKFDTSNVINMSRMFFAIGSNSPVFTLDLGDKFDTCNVTNMSNMFEREWSDLDNPIFTLDLGNKFDTSNVTNMSGMFAGAGQNSTAFTLDLGDKFDTSNVTDMSSMFSGANATYLDLGDKFDTSNVTDMSSMFSGANATYLDLGDKFDTSKVTNMSNMFYSTRNYNPDFTLDLGDNFDTSNVTDMSDMFGCTGYNSSVITLDLGDKFDTSNVTDMMQMFSRACLNENHGGNLNFSIDLGDKFDTSNVTNMYGMFSTIFNIETLNLGDKFDTSKVTDMSDMFRSTGRNSPVFTLNLGDKFDTSNVINMSNMFSSTGPDNSDFTLDLGANFDTGNVTNMSGMFSEMSGIGTLNLGDKFDTSSVTDMSGMFYFTGAYNLDFTLDLGDNFDTSNVTNMGGMFAETGYHSIEFSLDLRNFNVSTVTFSDLAFYTMNSSHKIYASSSNIDFISDPDKGFSGTIINCTTSPASCP